MDKPDAQLTKIFDKALDKTGAVDNVLSEGMMKGIKYEGNPKDDAKTSFLNTVGELCTEDTGNKLKSNLETVAAGLDQPTLAKALALAMDDPAFKSAFEAANPGLLDSMLAAAASQSTGKVDGMSTADLADALLTFSKEELLEMLRKTLMLDKPDVNLSKVFNRAVKLVDGLLPE